jgi:hypothetical protein
LTVASLPMTTTRVPSTVPMPVTMPALGVVVVEPGRGERAQLEERRAGVEQAVDPLPDRQLAALAMAGDRALAPPAPRSLTTAWRARRSATSARIASWLARVSSPAGSSRLRRTAIGRS